MEAPALKAAVELTLMPSRVRVLRESPLPDGVALLLRIAAGDLAAEKEASASLERSVTMVREASAFFIEQMMLHPKADSYRVLGARRDASAAELRQNMALLMRWLHPDANRADTRAVFVNRVNRAWDDLKTPERRRAYDQFLENPPASERKSSSGKRTNSNHEGRQRRPGVTTFRKRELQASDLLETSRGGHWGLMRRFLGLFLRPRR